MIGESELIFKDLETKSHLLKDLLSVIATRGAIKRKDWKPTENWAGVVHTQGPNLIVLNVLLLPQQTFILSHSSMKIWAQGTFKKVTVGLLTIVIVKTHGYYNLQIIFSITLLMIETPAPILCVLAMPRIVF